MPDDAFRTNKCFWSRLSVGNVGIGLCLRQQKYVGYVHVFGSLDHVEDDIGNVFGVERSKSLVNLGGFVFVSFKTHF